MRLPSMEHLIAFAMLVGASLAGACGGSSTTLDDSIPAGKPGQCATCHMPEFAQGGRHHVGKPPTCQVCHLETSWQPANVGHAWYVLDGAHATTECSGCHKGTPIVFEGTPKTCYGCHRKDYEQARNHEHRAKTCDDCHTTSKWKGAHDDGGDD